MIYVDANHDYLPVKEDIEKAMELFPNARIAGDDWDYEGVKRAVIECARD